MRVLVVEDHVNPALNIADGLRDRGIAADVTHDGQSAPQKRLVYRYDVVVLDRDLPVMHGERLCVAFREGGSDARILMLTAAATIRDRVEGLNLGADDYPLSRSRSRSCRTRTGARAARAPARRS